MNKKIIVIEGYLASGKSTFAFQLSKAVGVPYLIKDTLKTALCENILIESRAESSRFSAVTFSAIMYLTERLFETGYPIIIEGNFVPFGIKAVDEAGIIKALVDKYGYEALTYKFMGDTRVLYERFIEREKTPERGQVNKMGFVPSHNDFDKWCHNLDSFNIGGKVIKVDTTDFLAVDYDRLIKNADMFIKTT